MGHYDAALGLAEKGLSLARASRELEILVSLLNRVGHVRQERGEFDAALALFEEAAALVEDCSVGDLKYLIKNSIGMLEATRGDYVAARETLTDCVAYARAQDPVGLAAYLESLARAQFGLMDYTSAALSWKETLASSWPRHDHLNILLSLAGLCRTAEAQRDNARAVRLGAAVDRISAEWSLKVDPWPEPLEDVWRRARTKLSSLANRIWDEGWRMSLERTIGYALEDEAAAVAIDVGPITNRERQITSLVAAGLTNREIATHLFLSERTVEGHLDRIGSKLGLRSRTELAAWAADRGLTGRQQTH